MHRRNLQAAFCTSTPRSSRSFYDGPPDAQELQKQVQDVTPHLADAMPLPLDVANGQGGRPSICRRRLITTSSSGSLASTCQSGSSGRQRKSSARLPYHRLGNRGRSRARLSSTSQMSLKRMQQRNKIKDQRIGCFDRGRHLCDAEIDVTEEDAKQTLQVGNGTYALDEPNENNNYCVHNRNDSMMVMGATMLLDKQTWNCMNIKMESELEQSTEEAATFNVDRATVNSSFSKWEEEEHPALLKALAAKYDYDLDSNLTALQQFEEDHVCAWLSDGANISVGAVNHLSHDIHFEELCRQTASTAPFELQPLKYSPGLVEIVQHKKPLSASNITDNTSTVSCTTNCSSLQSWTTYSLSHIRTHRLPQINVTTMDRLSDLKHLPNHEQGNILMRLWHRQWRRMGVKKSLGLGILLFIVLTPFSSFLIATAAVGLFALAYLAISSSK